MTWRWCSDGVKRNPRYQGLPRPALGKASGDGLARDVHGRKLKEGESARLMLRRRLTPKTTNQSFHKVMRYETLAVGNYNGAPATRSSNTVAFVRRTCHMYISLGIVATFSTHGAFATPHNDSSYLYSTRLAIGTAVSGFPVTFARSLVCKWTRWARSIVAG